MNLSLVLRTLVFLGLCCGMLACEEAKTNTELLTDAVWKFSAFSNPDLDPDTRDFFEAILGTSTYQYNMDGTFDVVYTDSTFEDYNGTWAFAVDETVLVHDGGTADEAEFTIVTLDEETLMYQYTDSTGTNEVTWVH